MNKNIKQNFQISRINREEFKNKISFLAINAKNKLNQNQFITELIRIKKNQISKNKENLIKFTTLYNDIKNGNEFGNEIIKEIKSNNKELDSLNKNLRVQINNINNKYEYLKNAFFQNNENLFNQLDILKDTKFIYENALKEKKFKIAELKNYIDEIYIQLGDEKKILFAEDEYFEPDEEISNYLNNYKDLLYKKSKGFNKYKNLIKNLKRQNTELKRKIKSINRYINTLQNLNTNFDYIDFTNYNNNIYIEGEECMKEKKDDYNNIIEDSFNLSNDMEIQENQRYDLINNSIFEAETKLKLNYDIPKIDLSQINYNKKKLQLEEKEKSLSRDNKNSEDIYSIRINELKEKIKKNSEKKEIYIEKINKYKRKIKELKEVYRIESSSKDLFKIKSIKKRKLLFNSPNLLSYNSLSWRKKNMISNGFDNFSKINTFSEFRLYK